MFDLAYERTLHFEGNTGIMHLNVRSLKETN